MSRLNGRRIGIAIEQKHGAVVWMLLKYECVEIYPVRSENSNASACSDLNVGNVLVTLQVTVAEVVKDIG